MSDEIVDRIERDAGVPGLASILADRLPATDLQSLMLAVARRRAAATRPADVLRRYETDRFVQPAEADPERVDELMRQALRKLPPSFEQLELSPVAPLGTSSVVAGISQDWIVSTIRGSEVVSDPTNVLALECARRRRRDRGTPVRLSASHRALRAQRFQAPLSQHFRLLALCSAGRPRDAEQLLDEQVSFYEGFLTQIGAGPVTVDRALRKPAYYSGATFGISVRGAEVVEGGCVSWGAALLGDRKERLVVSGIGIDLLARILR